jgi:hypothetical protein
MVQSDLARPVLGIHGHWVLHRTGRWLDGGCGMTTHRATFLRYLEITRKLSEREHALYKVGLDIGNFVDDYYAAAKCLLDLAFTPEQVGWIEWWLYEKVEKQVTFTDGRPAMRLDTPEQLWDFLHTHCESHG